MTLRALMRPKKLKYSTLKYIPPMICVPLYNVTGNGNVFTLASRMSNFTRSKIGATALSIGSRTPGFGVATKMYKSLPKDRCLIDTINAMEPPLTSMCRAILIIPGMVPYGSFTHTMSFGSSKRTFTGVMRFGGGYGGAIGGSGAATSAGAGGSSSLGSSNIDNVWRACVCLGDGVGESVGVTAAW